MKSKLSSTMRRGTACAILAALVQGCTCEDRTDCNEGLIVTLGTQPAAPYTVELLYNDRLIPGPPGATCAVGASQPCARSMQFRINAREGVSVRVTSAEGVRTTDLPRIKYVRAKNDASCGNCAGIANVTID